jgi:hypothetical protein
MIPACSGNGLTLQGESWFDPDILRRRCQIHFVLKIIAKPEIEFVPFICGYAVGEFQRT